MAGIEGRAGPSTGFLQASHRLAQGSALVSGPHRPQSCEGEVMAPVCDHGAGWEPLMGDSQVGSEGAGVQTPGLSLGSFCVALPAGHCLVSLPAAGRWAMFFSCLCPPVLGLGWGGTRPWA